MHLLQPLLFIFFIVIFQQQLLAEDWGKTGHRVVGKVAQDHLTPKTKVAAVAYSKFIIDR